jgi:ribonuclease R
MQRLGHVAVAEVFDRLSQWEAEHLEALLARTQEIAIPEVAPGEYRWLDAGGPERASAPLELPLLTPRQALGIAPDATLLESVILRSQSLAVYAPDNIGHFGLALEAYAHFTSPIRRYPDLLVHRAIKHALAGGKPDQFTYSPHAMAALSLQCSERSRRADEAQREVDERYRAAWMESHVGKEFDGTISGVTSFGLFVELDDSKVNGLVHVTQLANDFYHFDAVRKTLTGERRGRSYRLGDRVRVVVLKASVEERKIDFRLVEDDARGTKPLPERGKPAKRVKQKY